MLIGYRCCGKENWFLLYSRLVSVQIILCTCKLSILKLNFVIISLSYFYGFSWIISCMEYYVKVLLWLFEGQPST